MCTTLSRRFLKFGKTCKNFTLHRHSMQGSLNLLQQRQPSACLQWRMLLRMLVRCLTKSLFNLTVRDKQKSPPSFVKSSAELRRSNRKAHNIEMGCILSIFDGGNDISTSKVSADPRRYWQRNPRVNGKH